jgi:HD-like signal output (HDOD) protein
MGFFGNLFTGKHSEEPVRELKRSSRATAERIRNILGIRELEMLPAQAARAFELASDPQSKTDDFVTVIESDEALSARVIRVANSVYFFRGTPATDIEKAVANIGLDELKSLLSATMLRSLLNTKHNAREQLWGNSVATAIASRQLARMTTHLSTGEAFLAGLLHDVGKLVMIRRGGQLYDRVLQLITSGERSFVEAEEEVFELNHVEVGQYVAEEWHFPPKVIEALAFHHLPPPQRESKLSLATLVQIADLIAHSLTLGHQPPLRAFSRKCKSELLPLLSRVNLDEESLERFAEELAAQYEKELSLYQSEQPR